MYSCVIVYNINTFHMNKLIHKLVNFRCIYLFKCNNKLASLFLKNIVKNNRYSMMLDVKKTLSTSFNREKYLKNISFSCNLNFFRAVSLIKSRILFFVGPSLKQLVLSHTSVVFITFRHFGALITLLICLR